MIDLIFIVFFFCGIGLWCCGVAAIVITGDPTLMRLFYILVGGQLVKVGMACFDANDQAKKHQEIIENLKRRGT